MEWKTKLDECCADELEEMIIDNIKAGFLSNSEILDECVDYLEDEYPNDTDNITKNVLLEIIEVFRNKYQNTGEQENFLKLDVAFHNLENRGVVALHCAGYTQSDGFDDCNEIAAECKEQGDKVIGCCFYTKQDLEHILHKESTLLYVSFANYDDEPTAVDIGQIIVEEFESAGVFTKWNKTADTRIAIKDLIWDKQFIECK